MRKKERGTAAAFSLPNVLSLLRVVLAPLIAGTFFLNIGTFTARCIALGLMIVADLSDAFDGYFARRLGQVSDFGKIIDPYADSLYRLTIFSVFTVMGYIPLWIFLIFLYRDLLTSVLRVLASLKNVAMAARTTGKIKSVLQGIGTIAVVAIDVVRSSPFDTGIPPIVFQKAIYFLCLAIALYSLAAALDSLVSYVRQIRKR